MTVIIMLRCHLAILVCAIVLLSTASAISSSFDSSAGGSYMDTKVALEDSFESHILLSADALENKHSGSGDFKESHWTSNSDKEPKAGVGVNIVNAKHYDYSWSTKKLDGKESTAREILNVDNAKSIEAWAEANNPQGSKARSELNIERGSLKGYTSDAWISSTELRTDQQFDATEGDVIKASCIGIREDTTSESNIWVKLSTMDYYLSNSNVQLSPHDDVNLIDTSQSSHLILGSSKESSFKGTTYLRDSYGTAIESATRIPDYGTEYSLVQGSNSKKGAIAHLTYYVSKSNPQANSIQGAINAACNKDTIQVDSGTYNENLVIDKSLEIRGSFVEPSIVDGQRKDSVVKIKKGARVDLDTLTLTNGQAEYGGGIYNSGDLVVEDCIIHTNKASKYGGGIYNEGILDMDGLGLKDGRVFHNEADYGGGVYNHAGSVYLNEKYPVSGNTAFKDGDNEYLEKR
jgi:hypothetical protein